MSASSSARNDHTSVIRFEDLPIETQKQIVSYVGRKDLFSLQALNAHFHGLASAEIYRTLDFNVVSSEAEDLGNPASRAADALQSILASEHDYGQHVKSFRMGAIADKCMVPPHSRHHGTYDDQLLMTRILWDSKADPSKFLNTALLLMARKASMLETFKWDAPIELSSAVYHALHKITSLRHLLVRLDVQPSPKIVQRQSHHPPPVAPPGMPPGPFPPTPLPPTAVQTYTPNFESNISKRRRVGSSKFWAKRRAFSGFKQLNTLEVVGISNLDCLSEIAQCITASSASLKSLTLTLSSDLARKSRKPATTTTATTGTALDEDVSDTDVDEEDDFMDPPLPPASNIVQPASEADIREEKLAQENILATVFDLQSVAQVGKKLEKKLSLARGKCLEEDEAQNSQDRLVAMMKSLKDSPFDVEQAKNMKAYLDSYIKCQQGPHKRSTTSPFKSTQLDSIKEYQSSLMMKKQQQQLLNSNQSALKSSESTPGLFSIPGHTTNNDGELQDQDFDKLFSSSYSHASPSAKASALDISSPHNHSGASSYGSFPLISHPPLINPKKSKSATGSPQLFEAISADSNKEKSMNNEHQLYLSTTSGQMYDSSVAAPYSTYPQGHTSSGSLTPTLNPSLYQSYGPPSSFPAPTYISGYGTVYPNNSTTTLGKQSKNSKAKKHASKKVKPPKPGSLPSSDESEVEVSGKFSSSPEMSSFAAKSDELPIDSMDVDMDHPDEVESDLGEDQEHILEPDAKHAEGGKAKASEPVAESLELDVDGLSRSSGSGSKVSANKTSSTARKYDSAAPTAAEAMQDYVRIAHGLQLEGIHLHYIPLKASIIGRALDLTVLRRITLLDVGPQDTFWALLVRLTDVNNKITFERIHTDHVSKAFIKFLATFEGLEELFMHERNAKNSESDPHLLADISGLRRLALNTHVSTLKRLMIRNERDDSWDVDTKTLQFLALKGKRLTELACSMKMQTYHLLIQMFAAFSNLHALHLIALRSTDRNTMLQLESLNFAVDSLSHCPGVKLRYLALADQVSSLESRPDHFRKHLKMVMDHEKDKKGKGKAVDFPLPLPMLKDKDEDDVSDRELDDVLAEVAAGEKRLRFSTRFDDVQGVKIFAKEIRTGRL